jgi:hypothetical protein
MQKVACVAGMRIRALQVTFGVGFRSVGCSKSIRGREPRSWMGASAYAGFESLCHLGDVIEMLDEGLGFRI